VLLDDETPLTMDDFEVEFDFEDELNADVGQPTEAPQSMPANARKNYRQVRREPEPPTNPKIFPVSLRCRWCPLDDERRGAAAADAAPRAWRCPCLAGGGGDGEGSACDE
jgi:hypothetical protein